MSSSRTEVLCAECQQSVPRENTIEYDSMFICAACKPLFVQRMREGVALPTGGIVYAGFWVRFWASLLDAILTWGMILPILISVYGWEYFGSNTYGNALVRGPVDLLLSWVFPALATLAFWIWKQATPGKMLFRVKIVDVRSGACPSTAQFVIRYLMYYVSLLPLGLGYIWVAFDERKQGWHDKVANTIVIRANKRSSQEQQRQNR